jgi:hypothetical protein
MAIVHGPRIDTPGHQSERLRWARFLFTRRFLLICGIVASVFYVVANDVIAASLYPDYDRISRPVSELSATYAPSRPVLVPLGVIFELLMIAFWIGVWRAAPANRALRVTSGLMLGFALLGLLAFPFPMVADEVLGANTIHTIIWGVITPLLMFAGIGASAAAFGRAFRLYAILTLVALAAFSVLAGIQAAQIDAGEPVRWFGVTERALIAPWLLWVAVLAIDLLRAHGTRPEDELDGESERGCAESRSPTGCLTRIGR